MIYLLFWVGFCVISICGAVREGFEGAQYFIGFLWTITILSMGGCIYYCFCNCSTGRKRRLRKLSPSYGLRDSSFTASSQSKTDQKPHGILKSQTSTGPAPIKSSDCSSRCCDCQLTNYKRSLSLQQIKNTPCYISLAQDLPCPHSGATMPTSFIAPSSQAPHQCCSRFLDLDASLDVSKYHATSRANTLPRRHNSIWRSQDTIPTSEDSHTVIPLCQHDMFASDDTIRRGQGVKGGIGINSMTPPFVDDRCPLCSKV